MSTYEEKKSKGLPAQLKAGVESMSGYSMDDVKVHYNSSKPAQMKALAYTQGTDIHVAPGQEQHLGHEAWHVVQQKQGRVAPTAQLKGMNVNTNSDLEHEADVMGAKAASWSASSSPVVQQKSAAGGEDAPMQFWGLDEHEKITMAGADLSGEAFTEDEKKALQVGAILNDVYENSGKRDKDHKFGFRFFQKSVSFREQGRFARKFSNHSDPYINETHHGGMQFLHTMSNDESPKENYIKQLAWAQFCLDVQAGTVTVEDTMFDYLTTHRTSKLFEMLMPMMVEYKNEKGKPETFPSYDRGGNKFSALERARAALVSAYRVNNNLPVPQKCKRSRYADMSLKDFFGNADLSGQQGQNYGLIAIGTMLHMLEDSFAGSHSIRGTNLNQEWFANVSQADMRNMDTGTRDSLTEADITSRLTRIILHANYNEQAATPVINNKHEKGDELSHKDINQTQGAAQAKVVVAYVLKQVKALNNMESIEDKKAKINEIMNFIKKVLLPEGVSPEDVGLERDESLPGLGRDDEQIDQENDIEAGGRVYSHMKWRKSLKSNARAKISEYRKLMKKDRGNATFKAHEKITQYAKECKLLDEAFKSTDNETCKLHIRKHIREILIDLSVICTQLENMTGMEQQNRPTGYTDDYVNEWKQYGRNILTNMHSYLNA